MIDLNSTIIKKMHSSSFDTEIANGNKDGGEVLVSIAALVTEVRIPGKLGGSGGAGAGLCKTKGFFEGPHCPLNKARENHKCDPADNLCSTFGSVRDQVLDLWKKNIPVCLEVLLGCSCKSSYDDDDILLEKWYFTINHRRSAEPLYFNFIQLMHAIRSQLYFSQLTAWLTTIQQQNQPNVDQDQQLKILITNKNIRYRLTLPGETFESSQFSLSAIKHEFPLTDIGNGYTATVSFLSLPRMSTMPSFICKKCAPSKLPPPPLLQQQQQQPKQESSESRTSTSTTTLDLTTPSGSKIKKKNNCSGLFDDRMHTLCTLKGKHRCEDFEDVVETPTTSPNIVNKSNNKKNMMAAVSKFKRLCQNDHNESTSSCSSTSLKIKPQLTVDVYKANAYNNSCSLVNNDKRDDLILDKGKLLLDAIERTGYRKIVGSNNSSKRCDDYKCVQNIINNDNVVVATSDIGICDKNMSESDNNCSIRKNKSNFNKNKKKIIGKYDDNDDKVVEEEHCAGSANRNNIICDSPMVVVPSFTNNKRNNKIKDFKDIEHINKKLAVVLNHHDDNNNNGNSGSRIGGARKKLTFGDDDIMADDLLVNDKKYDEIENNKIVQQQMQEIPSQFEQAKFRKDLDHAANMVFHSRTGLPLTSSPAPVRRGKSCFDFDSSINSVSAIKSALFSTSFSTDDESESDGSIVSPCSPETCTLPKRELSPVKYRRKGHAANLLGSFEESVLNGRLEPVSTVHGFSAELGASGAFVPKHLVVPVTVFFYTLGDNDKVSSPYLSHINLGRKGYNVPKSGTIQVTLFNPLGTVVKMFVIMYDLNDMPANSQTFIRQRTFYMPTNLRDEENAVEWGPKWLRYLIHLRFISSKSGKIYLHSDIRMIIFRKSDMDTATAHGMDSISYELRSFTHMPINPRFSPRK